MTVSMASETSSANITAGELTHGGKYMRYHLYGHVFEVSSKYIPPLRLLGRGTYGIVCSATNKEDNDEKVAIKKIGNAFANRLDAKRILREIKILRQLDHENIIGIKDIIRPPKRDNFNDVYIVYEVMDIDLDRIIRQKTQPLDDDQCQYFVYQVLKGLKYIHSANVLHRDLKPSNLFVNENCDLKIGDFGLARTKSESNFMTELVVTRWYRAPEVLLFSGYTFAIDVWSVGCILAELISRKPFFPGKSNIHQLILILQLLGTPDEASLGFVRNIHSRRVIHSLPRYPKQQLSERLPNDVSDLALDLLEKMLVFDPNQRITVDEALAHPYVSYYRDIDDEPICNRPLSFEFEQQLLTEEDIKELIWQESLEFNPDDPVQ